MLAATARKLDPPKRRSRRLPKIAAGTAMLAAAGVITAIVISSRTRGTSEPEPPGLRDSADQPVKVVRPGETPERGRADTEYSGLSARR